MFEINSLKNIKKNNFIFEMKNFYKNPDAVCDFLNKQNPYVHKWGEKNSLNTINFIDCRHKFINKEFQKTEIKIYKFLNRNIINAKGLVLTNFTKFFKDKNNFRDNYWWPHTDNNLYNCLIYLNKKPCDGTNIYLQIKENQEDEHVNPWQKKTNYILLQNIKSEYNKIVIFRSCLHHGMAYDTDKFSNKFRKNQVIFIQ